MNYKDPLTGEDYKLYITDNGCYGRGFMDKLPSGQAYLFEYAIWYAGQHDASDLYEPEAKVWKTS